MKINKTSMLVALLSTAALVSFAGLVSGTVAWYANTTHVSIEYSGTSVSSSQQIQIGLSFINTTVDDTDVQWTSAEATANKLTLEEYGGVKYYWAEPGRGLDSSVIVDYLGRQGFGTTVLEPVSTRDYNFGDDFTLYHCPYAFTASLDTLARQSSYCKIRFAFRILRPVSSGYTYVANKSIWLSETTAEEQHAGHPINEAVRLYFDNGETGHKFIVNPSASTSKIVGGVEQTVTQGTTRVAGLLNLDNDIFYDCDRYGQEIVYGDLVDSASFTLTDSFTEENAASLDDVNATGLDTSNENNASTFLAKHEEGNSGYLSATFTDEIEAQAKVSNWYTIAGIAPIDDELGNLSGGVYVAKTAESDNDVERIGTVDMTTFIDGWDHSVVDTQISYGFDLGLTFKVDMSS